MMYVDIDDDGDLGSLQHQTAVVIRVQNLDRNYRNAKRFYQNYQPTIPHILLHKLYTTS